VTGLRGVVSAGRRWLASRPSWARWLAVVGWMGLIFALSAQPDLPHPASGVLDWVVSSGGHVVEYTVLGALLAWALPPGRAGWAVALAGVYAVSDEMHQAFVPGRTPDPLDLVVDLFGATLGVWFLLQLRGRLGR
jgi:VanZ family protein